MLDRLAHSPVKPSVRIIAGLDLGQVSDYTGLSVLEQTESIDAAGKRRRDYAVRLLTRWPLHTSYTAIVEGVRHLAGSLPMKPLLVIDGTGAGRPVVEMFTRAGLPVARIIPVTITGGYKSGIEAGWWSAPKRDLVSVTSAALQSGRLKIAKQLREAATLRKELQHFRVKVNISTGNESFEAWREKDHDDLVLATALALWIGERGLRTFAIGGGK